MTSKAPLVAAVSAAAIVGGFYILSSSSFLGGGSLPPVDCRPKKDDCAVTLEHKVILWPPNYPDVIYVHVSPTDTLTISWTLNSKIASIFNAMGGINFKSATGQAIFSCGVDSTNPNLYKCTGKGLASGGTYDYGIKTKGFWSGRDVDPKVVND